MTEDERIERALKALTGIAAPEGMEQRVLRRLVSRPSKAGVRVGWFVVAGGIAAALALVFGLRRHEAAPVVAVAPEVKAVSLREIPHPTQEAAKNGAPRAFRVRTVRRTEAVSFPAPEAPLTEQERLLVKLAQARVAEAKQAVVVPHARDAKEVGLTHEEALLVAVSRVRQDAVIDALDPVRRAQTDERRKRDFKDFVDNKDGGS